MLIELTPYELRVIGCLLEKEVTTPDQYPLTLNSLTTAVNQKSSRDPVYSLSDIDVLETLDLLNTKHLVSHLEGVSSRVTKYQHRFCNTEFGTLQLSKQQRGILCVLMLRGPQMPGELRTRTQRLCEFSNMAEIDTVLTEMIEEGYIAQLSREPGKRESRYAHLFGADLPMTVSSPVEVTSKNDSDLSARVDELEREIAQLKILVNQLI